LFLHFELPSSSPSQNLQSKSYVCYLKAFEANLAASKRYLSTASSPSFSETAVYPIDSRKVYLLEKYV